MEKAPLKGSCLCGAVCYELVAPPVWAHVCHCSRCRKATGSAFAPNLFVPLDALLFTQGEEHLRAFQPPDAERFVQRLREEDLFKVPGVAETLDWTRALGQLDVINLNSDVVSNTLGVLLKYQDDVAKVEGAPAARLLEEIKAKALLPVAGG